MVSCNFCAINGNGCLYNTSIRISYSFHEIELIYKYRTQISKLFGRKIRDESTTHKLHVRFEIQKACTTDGRSYVHCRRQRFWSNTKQVRKQLSQEYVGWFDNRKGSALVIAGRCLSPTATHALRTLINDLGLWRRYPFFRLLVIYGYIKPWLYIYIYIYDIKRFWQEIDECKRAKFWIANFHTFQWS